MAPTTRSNHWLANRAMGFCLCSRGVELTFKRPVIP